MTNSVEPTKLDGRDTAKSTTSTAETIPERVEASVRGEDEPMEREHPRAPGAMVLFAYPLALVAILIVGVMALMMFW